MPNLTKLGLMATAAGFLAASPALALDLEFYFSLWLWAGAAADTIEALTSEYAAAHPRAEHQRHLCGFV